MLLIFICGWSASDRTRVARAAASRDVRVILTAVTDTQGDLSTLELSNSRACPSQLTCSRRLDFFFQARLPLAGSVSSCRLGFLSQTRLPLADSASSRRLGFFLQTQVPLVDHLASCRKDYNGPEQAGSGRSRLQMDGGGCE